jgi:hypothetical protein
MESGSFRNIRMLARALVTLRPINGGVPHARSFAVVGRCRLVRGRWCRAAVLDPRRELRNAARYGDPLGRAIFGIRADTFR